MKGERTGEPLVFAQTAVIVGFSLGKAGLFHEGMLLEVKPRAVGVGGHQGNAAAHGLGALAEGEEALAAKRFEVAFSLRIIAEAVGAESLLAEGHGLAFRLAVVQKIDIAVDEGVHTVEPVRVTVDLPGVLALVGRILLSVFRHI